MTEILFYHLQNTPLDKVLPSLLEKTLERDWRAVVQGLSADYIEALDSHLWTYRDDGFLAHGRDVDGHKDKQPVFLTISDDNPNGAQVRFYVEGATPGDDLAAISDYQRVINLFDGNDEAAVARARALWKQASAHGHDVTYWQQGVSGGWQKKGST